MKLPETAGETAETAAAETVVTAAEAVETVDTAVEAAARISFDAVIRMPESSPHKQFLVGCCSPFMRVAEHLTELRASCKQCLPGR